MHKNECQALLVADKEKYLRLGPFYRIVDKWVITFWFPLLPISMEIAENELMDPFEMKIHHADAKTRMLAILRGW